jgi:group I intron endonuclease
MENEYYGVIYKITNLVNGKIYIGQTKQKPERRWSRHKHNSKNNINGSLIAKAIRKYGEENFTFETIDHAECTESLNKLEEKYINELNCLTPNGYNIEAYNIGDKIISEDTKTKLAKINTNKKKNNSSSKYMGVYYNKTNNKWGSYIIFQRKRLTLGYFILETDAAKARDIEILKEEYGGIFELNFPELKESYLNRYIILKSDTRKRKIKCIIDNVEYSSIREASLKLGIPHSTLCFRLHNNKI